MRCHSPSRRPASKTGTYSEGRPAMTDLQTSPGFDRAAVLAQVAAVEARSEHPVGRALLAAAEAEWTSLNEVRDTVAAG